VDFAASRPGVGLRRGVRPDAAPTRAALWLEHAQIRVRRQHPLIVLACCLVPQVVKHGCLVSTEDCACRLLLALMLVHRVVVMLEQRRYPFAVDTHFTAT